MRQAATGGGSQHEALLREVVVRGAVTRRVLGERLGLSAASLTRLSKPLLDAGFLAEGRAETTSAGRPARPLVVVAEAATCVGVKLTGDAAYAVRTDLRVGVLAEAASALPSREPADVADVVARLVREVSGERAAMVAVTLGGDVRDGVVTRAPYLAWSNVRFGDLLQARIGVPVLVDNDLVGLAAAEHWFGSGRGRDAFVLLTIGAGVGHALVVHDEVVVSPDSGLGLAGHIPLDPGGPACALGHAGCASAVLTTVGIQAQARAAGLDVDFGGVLALAAAGDGAASAIVDRAAGALGRLVALATNLTLQTRVVLGGDGIALWDAASDAIRAAAVAERDPDAAPLELIVDRSGFSAWARGAAALAVQRVVADVAAAVAAP